MKEKQGYKSGDGLKGTVADLNAANFRNKDVSKWSKKKKSTKKPPSSGAVAGLGRLNQTTKIPRLGTKKRK